MLNLNREITPEDFAYDYNRAFYVTPEGDREQREYRAELAELKRLYEISGSDQSESPRKA